LASVELASLGLGMLFLLQVYVFLKLQTVKDEIYYAVKVDEASAHSVYVKEGSLSVVAVCLAVLFLLGLYLPYLSQNDAP
jgi:hypothetical protein